MGAFRRVFAAIGLFVSLAGFIVFLSAAVVVWWVKAETNRRTDELVVKAHSAVDVADGAVVFVRDVIKQGEDDLQHVKANPAPPQEPVNPFLQLTARKASENLAGSVDRAQTAVLTASDATVVAEAALHVFGEESQLPGLKHWLGIKPEQLAQTKTGLDRAKSELTQVRTVLGVPLGDGGPTQEQLATVENGLRQARELTDQMGKVVATARTRVDETKRAVDMWVLRLALLVTLIGVVGAAGQFFMARFCVRTLRGLPA